MRLNLDDAVQFLCACQLERRSMILNILPGIDLFYDYGEVRHQLVQLTHEDIQRKLLHWLELAVENLGPAPGAFIFHDRYHVIMLSRVQYRKGVLAEIGWPSTTRRLYLPAIAADAGYC